MKAPIRSVENHRDDRTIDREWLMQADESRRSEM